MGVNGRGEIGRDLQRALVGREQVQHKRLSAEARPLARSDEVLQSRRDPGRLSLLVMNPELAPRAQTDALGSLAVEEPPLLLGQSTLDTAKQRVGLPQLGETRAAGAQGPQTRLDGGVVQARQARPALGNLVDACSEKRELFGITEARRV